MTALSKYERLESTGLWRESLEAQRRDVHIAFGNASLIIKDHTDTALTHWSLPAIQRQNPGQRPALFVPGSDSNEELEIDDPTMIDAIEKVRRTIERRRPKAGRVRVAVLLSIVTVIAALGLFWLPGAMTRHTVSVVPDSKRQAIGLDLFRHVESLTGQSCHAARGSAALNRLAARVLGRSDRSVRVMRDMARDWADLPGGLLLISRRVVEDHDIPDVAAGYLILADMYQDQRDPLSEVLNHAGTRATLTLLTTGEVSDEVLKAYASDLLVQSPSDVETAEILDRFEVAKVPSTPFAYARDITGETVLPLIEADPFRGEPTPSLLSDADWVSLQDICLQ